MEENKNPSFGVVMFKRDILAMLNNNRPRQVTQTFQWGKVVIGCDEDNFEVKITFEAEGD